MGAFIAATPHVLVENNTFERNGLGPDNCTSDLWGGQNYSHCHGIYLSNPAFACSSQMSNVTIRRNRFLGNSGSGIQVYSNCSESEKHFHHLIENNLFVNNATGMYLWSVRSSIIRNNTIVQLDWPRPQINALVGLDLLGAAANLLANNVVYAPDIESAVIRTWHPTSNIWTNNALFAKGDASWHWELVPAVFSLAQYQQKSGDPAPVGATIADPSVDVAGFVNLLGGDYHLTASSLLRNSGASAHCPAVDLDGRPRPQETQCDIGAYEFE
jgi:parallel beta-helix repeat protein